MNVILAKIRLLAFKKTNDRIFCPKWFFFFRRKSPRRPRTERDKCTNLKNVRPFLARVFFRLKSRLGVLFPLKTEKWPFFEERKKSLSFHFQRPKKIQTLPGHFCKLCAHFFVGKKLYRYFLHRSRWTSFTLIVYVKGGGEKKIVPHFVRR